MRDGVSCALRGVLTLMIMAAGFRYVAAPWIFSFFYSFQWHIGVAVTAGALLAYLIKRGTVPLVQLALGLFLFIHPLLMQRDFAQTPLAVPPGHVLTLMSLNVLGDNFENADKIADEIMGSDADIVYVLEAEPLGPRLPRLREKYPHQIGCGQLTDTCDLVVLSRLPMDGPRVADLSDLRRHRYAQFDVALAGRKVHFAAAHLSKPYFDDYHTEELEEIAKLFARRGGGDFVLAGDFNSGSIAPDMRDFFRATGLRTAAAEPATWPIAAGSFGIAIDHVYATTGVSILSVDRVDNNGSNHFGLKARLGFTTP